VNFIAIQFELGLEYRTLNVYRSVISATHPQIQGWNVGKHPVIVQLLKGIFNSRPPMPRYINTWDVNAVTKYFESCSANDKLTLKQLSKKLVVLLALTSAERGSELIAHDLRFRRFHPEGVSFNLPELTK
jgi:hypothetical protein